MTVRNWVADSFMQAPIPDSFKKAKQDEEEKGANALRGKHLDLVVVVANSHLEAESEPTRPIDDGEMTFM